MTPTTIATAVDFATLAPEAICRHSGQDWARGSRTSNALETVKRDLGFKDSKGRMIGGSVSIGIETRELGGNGHTLTQWIGGKFTATPHALRDGEWFGASQDRKYFTTMEEVRAYIEKYFAQATKRAAKVGTAA